MQALNEAFTEANQLRTRIERAVFGQSELVTEALCCLLSGGHLLMTGAPGLAKTTLVRVIARGLGLKFGRVQFTPDLLPGDIIGTDILNIDAGSGRRSFEFSKGPIFVNLLLADEINRASPRTQSALLEAMQERTCTVSGVQHPLPLPFMVFATQNPFESEGTFPLPEAQMDRFLMHSLVNYPDVAAEEMILQAHVRGDLVGERPASVASGETDSTWTAQTLQGLIDRAKTIAMPDELIKIINELVRSTRPEDAAFPANLRGAIVYGAGPRAGISLVSVSRSLALLSGAETVRWQHIRRVAKPVMRHRLRLSAQAVRDKLTEDAVVESLLINLEERYQELAGA